MRTTSRSPIKRMLTITLPPPPPSPKSAFGNPQSPPPSPPRPSPATLPLHHTNPDTHEAPMSLSPLAPMIEPLEPRRLLAATGPVIAAVHILGSVARGQGIVLTFDSPLDPTTAQSPLSYLFGKPAPKNTTDNGIDLGNILGFLAKPNTPAVKEGKIQFLGARYDDATQSVTLTPVKSFNLWKFFRILRIKGTGNNAVKDLAGNPLNGGTDTVLHWDRHQGKTLKYLDSDGDKITLTLKGPGKLYGFFHKSGNPFPSIFASNTKVGKSTLTATLQQSPTGDGIAHIAQLSGPVPATSNIFSDTRFDIQAV